MLFNRTVAGLALSIGLLSPLGFYARGLRDRPPQTSLKTPLFQGINYERQYRSSPRPHLIHILTLDLTTPGLEPFVTPGMIEAGMEFDTRAQTTSEFLQFFQLQLAVNAGFFSPFSEKTPWDFYPHSGDRTNVIGEFISDSVRYSEHPLKWPTLCFRADTTAVIVENQLCPPDTRHAVSGNLALYPRPSPETRQRPFKSSMNKPYPRTVAAINTAGDQLWIVVIDGKQPDYSEGLTLSEVEALLAELGVYKAVNLDGGGSVTLAYAQRRAQLLNAPIHGKWPMTERPIATHLGFYAPLLD